MSDSRHAAIFIAVLGAIVASATTTDARPPPAAPGLAAPLDPERAARDVPDVLRENNAFCKQPIRPLPSRARELCSVAARLPDCEGFRAACAEERGPAVHEPPKPKSGSFVETLQKALGDIAHGLIWVLILAVAVAVLFPLLRLLVRTRKDKALSETTSDAKTVTGRASRAAEELLQEEDAELLLRRAAEHAQQGNLEAALFSYLNASLRALDHRGAIRIARHRTNGEYVRACSEEPARESLYAIVRDVDRVQFGGAQATEDVVSRAASRAVAIVRSGPSPEGAARGLALTTLLVMVLALSAGCGFHIPRGARASDPSGHEVLGELLLRQGVTVKRLGSSLASVPIDDRNGQGPTFAILVDTDRTILETNTEEHLIRWVRAGGFLILAGSPLHWPNDLGAISEPSSSAEIETEPDADEMLDPDEEEEDEEAPKAPPPPANVHRAKLVEPVAMRSPRAVPLAHTGDGKLYAAFQAIARGKVITLASSDLLTNAQLAQPENAGALIALLRTLDRRELRIARAEDGISPVTNPITALERAGLGLGLYHALAATLVLFAAVGARLARSRRNVPEVRRAFTEHIEATGTFYYRRRASAHALAAYARYAEERVRQRLPRGAQDIGAWLAQRSGVDARECAEVWQRATSVHAFAVPRGDELFVLKKLSAIVSAALRMD
ncbi:DUF4350 domain-containing protein [Pendulispora albinea]|uniref:DUF4350 domain-containing protein n=1 Tax=Pendulispora albinea TaxID=2741071 RepID=A0ABZ2LX47_9BACT